MPATSPAQRRFFAWKMSQPGSDKQMGMSKSQMSDYVHTPDSAMHADAGMPPAKSRFKRWIGHSNANQSVFPGAHEVEGVQHGFAKTTDGPAGRMDSGGTAHWMQNAVKRPGALTKKANAAGESPMGFARKNYHAKGRTGEQARFAVNAQK